MSRVVVIVPPLPIVELADLKQHVKVEHDDDDALLAAYLAAATGHIDGPDGWLGRALGVQTLEAGLDGFVYDPISLPCRPINAIVSIRYEDAAGVWRDLAPDVYELKDDVVGTAWGKTWPTTRAYRGPSRSVVIRYQAGYENVPAPIRVAVMMMAADLYKFRESVTGGNASKVQIPAAAEMLLTPFRVYF
ncbi:MAG: head-tail connector protein [Aliihoeflea sp.]